eukprot:714288-Alexandrium_andersonii.AAC.1
MLCILLPRGFVRVFHHWWKTLCTVKTGSRPHAHGAAVPSASRVLGPFASKQFGLSFVALPAVPGHLLVPHHWE